MPAKPGGHKNAIRVGEQDSWAYLAYEHGADVLKEMFVVNGDNPTIKRDIINKIETEGSADYDEKDYQGLMESGASTVFKTYSLVAGLSIK